MTRLDERRAAREERRAERVSALDEDVETFKQVTKEHG